MKQILLPVCREYCRNSTSHLIYGNSSSYTICRLLLIWLLQQTPIGSVEGCPDRRFLRRYASFKPTSPEKRLASSTSRAVAGPMVSSALDADIGEPMNWQTNDAGSVLAAGTKSR
jgi:hypothetical protein